MIGLCIFAGALLRRSGVLPADAGKSINVWLLYIALPAVSLKYIPKIEWSLPMLFPVLSTVIVWVGSWVFIGLYAKQRSYGQRTKSTLELASGYSNTSFIGFPLIVAFFGEQFLSIAIICDQVLFVLLSTAGIVAAVKGDRTSGGSVEARVIFKKLVSFPPFIGCISALILPQFLDLSVAEPFLGKLAGTVAPLALFSVGSQLSFKGWARQRSQLSVSLLYKLILAPVLVLAVALMLGVGGDIARISVFEASMPTFITAGVVAEQFNLNFRLVNLIIGFSIAAGFLTTFIWAMVLQNVF